MNVFKECEELEVVEKKKCQVADGRTELEKQQEEIIKGQQEELNRLRIENNLMRELLSRPVTYTYGVR